LDWLAVEFREGGWAMKHLHRLIVTSSAYRMSSSAAENDTAAAADRDNVYYWRMNPIRLESQVVRDALLHLSGELDLSLGGPSVNVKKNEFSLRRSLYFVHSHNEHHRFLVMFDDADVLDCYRRDQSIVPQQALALANAKQSLEAAGKITAAIAKRVAATDDEGFVRAAFAMILSYEPTADETTACREALAAWRKLPPPKGETVADRARTNLVHALLNHNDFITVK
jgi:hypothetical protein